MIAETPNYLRKICKEYEQVENYAEAVADETQEWIMHHRRGIDEGKSIKELDDEGKYINVPPEDLIFITRSEHAKLHNTGKHLSAETKKKMSDAKNGENHPLYGKHLSAETKKKMSDAHKGKAFSSEHRKKMSDAHKGKVFSAEAKKKMSDAQKGKRRSEKTKKKMSDAMKGKHWYNNGEVNIFSKECPGEGFERGRLRV